MTNHPRQNWMNHCNNIWLRPTLSSMATARKAKKRIIHFRCERPKEICVCFVLLLVTPIDLFTNSADMFGSRPFKSFVQSFDTWYSDKKACRPLYRIHSQHKHPRKKSSSTKNAKKRSSSHGQPQVSIHGCVAHLGTFWDVSKEQPTSICCLVYRQLVFDTFHTCCEASCQAILAMADGACPGRMPNLRPANWSRISWQLRSLDLLKQTPKRRFGRLNMAV